MTIGMAINSNADIDAKREILGRLVELVELSAEVGLWFDGRPAALTFSQLAKQMRESIHEESCTCATGNCDQHPASQYVTGECTL